LEVSSQNFAQCWDLLLYSHPVFVYVMPQSAGYVERANYPVKHEPGRKSITRAMPNTWYLSFLHCYIEINFFALKTIQGVSPLGNITAGGNFLGVCDQKSSYKHVFDFRRLRSCGHFLIPVHDLV
jgi:hypothetical protein